MGKTVECERFMSWSQHLNLDIKKMLRDEFEFSFTQSYCQESLYHSLGEQDEPTGLRPVYLNGHRINHSLARAEKNTDRWNLKEKVLFAECRWHGANGVLSGVDDRKLRERSSRSHDVSLRGLCLEDESLDLTIRQVVPLGHCIVILWAGERLQLTIRRWCIYVLKFGLHIRERGKMDQNSDSGSAVN